MTEKKVRTYKVTVSVTVDDASKYDEEFDTLWKKLWSDFKALTRSYARGSDRLTIEAERIPN